MTNPQERYFHRKDVKEDVEEAKEFLSRRLWADGGLKSANMAQIKESLNNGAVVVIEDRRIRIGRLPVEKR